MKQRLTFTLYSHEGHGLYKRFARTVLWHVLLNTDYKLLTTWQDKTQVMGQDLSNLQEQIASSTVLAQRWQDFNQGDGQQCQVTLRSQAQVHVIAYFEIIDRSLCLLEFLWLNQAVSEQQYRKQKRKFCNVFIDTCAQFLASVKRQQSSELKNKDDASKTKPSSVKSKVSTISKTIATKETTVTAQ